MDFAHDDDQQSIRELASKLLAEESSHERQRAIETSGGPRFDRALWQKLAAAGLLGTALPEAHGGAGLGFLEVALVCDFVVADPAARFGAPEIRLGLMPGAGATQRLPRRIGTAAAKAMIMLGSTVDAAEAQRLGLVHTVSAPGEALAAGRALAEELSSLPAVAVRAVKRALAEGLADGLDRERELFLEVFGSADAREGVEAFRARRPPRFGHA